MAPADEEAPRRMYTLNSLRMHSISIQTYSTVQVMYIQVFPVTHTHTCTSDSVYIYICIYIYDDDDDDYDDDMYIYDDIRC